NQLASMSCPKVNARSVTFYANSTERASERHTAELLPVACRISKTVLQTSTPVCEQLILMPKSTSIAVLSQVNASSVTFYANSTERASERHTAELLPVACRISK